MKTPTKKRIRNIIMSALFAPIIVSCSTHHLAQGNVAYDQMAYADAVNHYEKVKEDKLDYKSTKNLAESYHNLNDPMSAKKWYKKAVQYPSSTDEDMLRYAQTLEATKEYEEANVWYSKYFKENTSDLAAFTRMISTDTIEIRKDKSSDIKIRNLDLNSDRYANTTPQLYNDGVIFTTERNKSGQNKIHPWTERRFTELNYGEINEDGEIVNTEVFAKEIQTAYDDGIASFSPDQKRIYFTRSNVKDGEVKTDQNNVVNHKIFTAELIDDQWTNLRELRINSDEYSCIHPFVSPDGTKLYFASDMLGSIGSSDIFVCDLAPDGSVYNVKNLGYIINTDRSEITPTIILDENGNEVIYFASEGHFGYGMHDIFKSINKNGVWSQPEPLPRPINSSKDDIGIAFLNNENKGYITSTRESEDGIYSIFYFEEKQPATFLMVRVVSSESNELLSEADIMLKKNNEVVNEFTDEAIILQTVNENNEFEVSVHAEGYKANTETVMIPEKAAGDTIEIVMNLDPKKISQETTIVEIPNVEIIYFDFDKANIKSEEQDKLNEVAEIMKKYPQIELQLNGHTDARGSDAYNDELSQDRAKAAKQYLINKGIDSNRIDIDSYGEDKLVNDCDGENDCPEKKHQKNRRTVVKLLIENDEMSSSSNK